MDEFLSILSKYFLIFVISAKKKGYQELLPIKIEHRVDANDIHELLQLQHEDPPSIATVQRIFKKHGINRSKGRRSKKTMEKKRKTLQSLKQQNPQ